MKPTKKPQKSLPFMSPRYVGLVNFNTYPRLLVFTPFEGQKQGVPIGRPQAVLNSVSLTPDDLEYASVQVARIRLIEHRNIDRVFLKLIGRSGDLYDQATL